MEFLVDDVGFNHKTKVEREHGQSDENMLTKSHDVVYCFHI